MNKTCSVCGQSIEENVKTCPFCNNNLNSENQDQEVQSKIMIEENKSEINLNEVATIQIQQSESNILNNDNKLISSSPVEISDTIIDTNNLNEEINNTFEEVVVDNVNLETITVNDNSINLEVEEQKVEMPEIPEPIINEIDSNLLKNFYDENERENNEKRVLKQQREAEQERIRQEDAAKNASKPIERPDLLAGFNLNEEQMPKQEAIPKQLTKQKKKGKSLRLIMLLSIITILLVALWFLVLKYNI